MMVELMRDGLANAHELDRLDPHVSVLGTALAISGKRPHALLPLEPVTKHGFAIVD